MQVSIDSWSFIHIQNFMMIGFVLPNRVVGMCIYGVIWELIEYYLANLDLTRTDLDIIWYVRTWRSRGRRAPRCSTS